MLWGISGFTEERALKTLEKGAVYGGTFGEDIIGFRCSECGGVFDSMFGDTCLGCREKERRHREVIEALKGGKS